jgi:predicted DNA-binding transcriptional regulator YafY
MKRSERLHAVTEYLRRRRTPVTVADLARYFEVDERTVFRDLASLREQQVPIVGEPGRGGGLQLHRDYQMPPLALSVDEGVSLWLSYRLAAVLGTLPAGRPLAPAVDKVLGSVPRERRAAILAVIERIVMARPARPETIACARPLDAGTYRTCERAFIAGRTLALDYVDRNGAPTTRVVEPHGLLVAPPLWYLLAHDRLRGEPRMFRVDRIRGATLREGDRFEPRDPRRMFAEIEAYGLELKE